MVLATVVAATVLAGCGGSHRSASTSAGTPTTTPGTTGTTGGGTGTSATTGTGTGTTTGAGTGTATSGTGTSSTPTSTTTTSAPPPSGPRLPATFTIRGNAVTPVIVSGPSSVVVALTVVSGDHKPHRVLVRTAPPHLLRVAAGGRVSLLLAGLRDGSYVLEFDGGTATATLQIGAQPGP